MYRTYRDTETGGFITKRDGGASIRFMNGYIHIARFVVDAKLREIALETGIKSHHAYIESEDIPVIRAQPMYSRQGDEIKYSLEHGNFYIVGEDPAEYDLVGQLGVELVQGRMFVSKN